MAKFVVLVVMLIAPLLRAAEPASAPLRVCLPPFRGDAEGEAVRDVVFETLLSSKRFTLSEKCGDDTDLTIRGSVLSKTLQRSRAEGESTQHASVAGTADRRGAAVGGLAVGSEERLASSETRSETTVTFRVVQKDGTVVWAGSWDSTGGKSRNSITDAAERVSRRFLREYPSTAPAKDQSAPPK